MAVVQICRKNIDNTTGKELSRRNEVRLLIQNINSDNDNGERSLLQVQNLTADAGQGDQFLDIIPVSATNVLVVYGKGVEGYEFTTDKGIQPPKGIRKGAVLMDIGKQEALKHIPVFLESSSQLEGLMLSSQLTYIIDSDLKVFKYDSAAFQYQVKACSFKRNSARLALDGRYIIGITCDCRKIAVVRTADDKLLGSVFVHGRASCLEIANDDRTIVVGCEDGRVMIMSLILEFADPLREFIERLPSRYDDDFDGNLIVSDVRRLSLSTPDQHRLSARLRKSAQAEERRPPSYTTLQRAVTVSRQSNRERTSSTCAQQ